MRFGTRKSRKATSSQDQRALVDRLDGRSIVLVGLMGSGKTSVGRRLAKRLDMRFVDADEEIEAAAHMTIPEIFARHGEAYFRNGEHRVIARVLAEGPVVLATGGGAFMNEATRLAIAQNGISIWLKAELTVLIERVMRRPAGDRPMLTQGGRSAEENMANLMQVRYPIYALADVTVETRDVSHEVVVDEVLEALASCPKLSPWSES